MSNEPLTLYHFPRSHSTRARWWLEEIGVGYESVVIDIRRGEQDSEEFRRISPLGQIPVLIDGASTIYESMAICLHLGFRFPDSGLSPQVGTPESASYLRWLEFGTTRTDRAVGRLYSVVKARHLEVAEAALESAKISFSEILAVYDSQLTQTEFLAGGTLSGADLYNASIMAFADSIEMIPAGGAIRDWLDRLTALPSYSRAINRSRGRPNRRSNASN